MFRRRRDEDSASGASTGETVSETNGDLPTLKPFLRASLDEPIPAAARAATPVSPVTAAIARPDLPRRLDVPSPIPARSLGAAATPSFGASPAAPMPSASIASPSPAPASPPVSENEGKKLIVGRDIKLHGEITSCDHLLVEGSVEATLTDGKIIDIAQSGTFNGAVECETASIRGKFEGDLTCTERLVVRSTGRIIGKIRYRQLEVERGGELSGDVQMIQGGAAAQATVTPIFGESEDSRMDPIAAVVSGDR